VKSDSLVFEYRVSLLTAQRFRGGSGYCLGKRQCSSLLCCRGAGVISSA
jgi:hypothetical protein